MYLFMSRHTLNVSSLAFNLIFGMVFSLERQSELKHEISYNSKDTGCFSIYSLAAFRKYYSV